MPQRMCFVSHAIQEISHIILYICLRPKLSFPKNKIVWKSKEESYLI